MISLPRLVLVLALAMSGARGTESAEQDMSVILRNQLNRYPAMQLQDAYKLLVQAILGAEHALDDAASVKKWMEREVAALGPGPTEPLVDPITPDGTLVRVHLRPFVAAGGDPDRLVNAFVQTARLGHASREKLASAWAELVKLGAAGKLPWTSEAMRRYGDEMAAAGWPAVHHSVIFSTNYRPAYRVIAQECLTDGLPIQN